MLTAAEVLIGEEGEVTGTPWRDAGNPEVTNDPPGNSEVTRDPWLRVGNLEEESALGPEQGGQSRGLADPGQPSRGDIEHHVLAGHVPFRPWCPHCVAEGAGSPPKAVGGGRDYSPEGVTGLCFLYRRE